MILEKLEIKKVDIPLEKPFKTALRIVETVNSVQVKITTKDGFCGYGAASPTVVITGDTIGSIESAIHELWIRIQGKSIEDWDELMRTVHTSIIGNTSAKAAVDIALHDLRAKKLQMPLYKLLGGARTSLRSDMTISLDTPEIMAADAEKAVENGFTALKIKLGNDAVMDLKRMKAINQAVGNQASFRLDANQGWSPKEAVRVVNLMLDAGIEIELVEQPVKADDFEGMKFVTDNLSIPILADESVFSYKDAIRLIQMRAADWINIKLMKTGGIEPAMRIISFAEAFGINCMIGCMMEGPIGISAAVHLGCGRSQIGLADLDVPSMYLNKLDVGFVSSQSTLKPNSNYGLGLDDSMDKSNGENIVQF